MPPGCVNGLWGANCNMQCGHCWNNTTCDKNTGECLSSLPMCESGFQGSYCTKRKCFKLLLDFMLLPYKTFHVVKFLILRINESKFVISEDNNQNTGLEVHIKVNYTQRETNFRGEIE